MKKAYRIIMITFFIVLFLGRASAISGDVDIHGFISQGYLKTNKNNYLAKTEDGSFHFNEMGINFTTYVASDLKLGCQFFARDLGDVGNDDVVVNWAFAEYTYTNWLGLRTGIIKFAFGLYNDTRDFDSLRTSIFLPSSVYNEWLRDGFDKMKGFEFFGSVEMGVLGLMKYQVQVGTNPIPITSGAGKYMTEVRPEKLERLTKIEQTKDFTCGRLFWKTPLDGLLLGTTYIDFGVAYEGEYMGNPISIDAGNTDIYVFSAEFVYQNLKFAAENYWILGDAIAKIYFPDLTEPYSYKSISDNKESYYISICCQFSERFSSALYFSNASVGKDSYGDTSRLKDQCISFRFDINPYWIAKLEAHLMDGQYGVEPANDGDTYSDWTLFAAKMSFSF